MIDLKELNRQDPIKRTVERGLESEVNSPMDPPAAYSDPTVAPVNEGELDPVLALLIDEHKEAIHQIEAFENALVQFKSNGYKLDEKINETFGAFFRHLDEKILAHNMKEEKTLFPLLHKKLIESGEHSKGLIPKTAIDIMEDDHVKFIQLGALGFNLLGLATRIHDDRSRTFIFDVAYENCRELIELLKLHIYREDHTLFPLAQKLISKEEYKDIFKEMARF